MENCIFPENQSSNGKYCWGILNSGKCDGSDVKYNGQVQVAILVDLRN